VPLKLEKTATTTVTATSLDAMLFFVASNATRYHQRTLIPSTSSKELLKRKAIWFNNEDDDPNV
jgi:hypothetical protein